MLRLLLFVFFPSTTVFFFFLLLLLNTLTLFLAHLFRNNKIYKITASFKAMTRFFSLRKEQSRFSPKGKQKHNPKKQNKKKPPP